MDCNFFSYHWTQISGKEILDQGEGYYFTSLPDYDVADIKEQTKTVFDLHPASVITIQNVQPISKELFEQKTGKPFFL